MKSAKWLCAFVVAGTFGVPRGASAAAIRIIDEDPSLILEHSAFDHFLFDTSGRERVSFRGDWIASHGSDGEGIIFFVEPDTGKLSDVLEVSFSFTPFTPFFPRGVATIDGRFTSDVDGKFPPGTPFPPTETFPVVVETAAGALVTDMFVDRSGRHVELPDRLTIFVRSDLERRVPEPSLTLLLGAGLLGLAFHSRRRR